MIIFPHLLIGAAIGLKIHNPLAIFILALVSHFIADKIPHWEYLSKRLKDLSKKEFLAFLLKVAADGLLGLLLLFWLLQNQSSWPYAIFGAVISALPDLPLFFLRFFPRVKWLSFYQKLHNANHLDQENTQKNILPIISELTVAALAILAIGLK